MVAYIKPIWGTRAENDLREIYRFYADENEEYAHRIIENIVKNAASIVFAEQYQEDETLGLPYRRFFCKTLENSL